MLLLMTVLLSCLTQAQSWVQSSILRQHFNYQLGQVFVMPTHQIAGVKVYGIDLFDTPASTVASLNAAGLVPICYFSTQYENWRPDNLSFPASALGSNLDNWGGERYVDTRRIEIRNIMAARIQLCKQKGFKAIDPDNTDCFGTCKSGFPLTASHALQFLQFLSDTARAAGLGVGLKNSLSLINATTVSMWDFAINEECYRYNECSLYSPFKKAGKTIFNMEYSNFYSLSKFNSNVCSKVNTFGTVSIRKALALLAKPRDACVLPTLASRHPRHNQAQVPPLEPAHHPHLHSGHPQVPSLALTKFATSC
ncbi:glycoside hydrolase superfamily [Scenedesmus sp. NREL 46B-D3]|nr:glycoside hydrolase superfamily [Scenedesmus sp. NREL 46B-D3]